MKVYPDGDAWERCLAEESVEYITALVKEILRFHTVIPMCLPRRSIKDISYQEATIPAGTYFYMNAYAADYDETYFDKPYSFIPERYLKDKESSITGTPHYAFGAGSRMCIGAHLANRELYTAFLRIILSFKILPPKNKEDEVILNCMDANKAKSALVAQPRDFKCRFVVRDQALLNKWMEGSTQRTADLYYETDYGQKKESKEKTL